MNASSDEPTGTNNHNPNNIIGDYVLGERLGGSDYSSTYKGVNQKTQESAAIKKFAKSLPLSIDLYDAEIKAYKTLSGIPGVLQLIDSLDNDNFFFLITEFIEEGSLRNILRNYPEGMNIEDVISLFTPIADTIDRIHDKKIIHRDLKPENILYRKTGKGYEIFITDFSVVKFTTTSQQFQTENTAGTSLYLAPEALFGNPEIFQSKAVDIYALGVMLYEALEGKFPYEDINQVIYKQPALFPARTIQKAGEFVAGFLLKTIHNDPAQRPDSAKDVMNGIRNAADSNLSEKQREEQRWVGRKVNNYKVEEVLGLGKMGTTLRASDLQTNKQVVLKAFAHSMQRNEKAYKKEIDSLEKLESGHGVLKPYEIFDYENISFIVTEYQSGGTLRNLLTRRPKIPTNDMMEIFTQIAEAIDYIHEKKIVHRDIKPENIVYSIHEEKIIPYITDFGVSAILASTQASFPTHHIGTRRYMAPELRDENTRGTKAVDIYAFGVMLYEALEGHAPFESPTRRRHESSQALTAEKTLKALGVNAKNILLQALAPDAEERPKTATEIMQQIRRQGMHEMFLGKKYGKYTIEKFIGRGTYGATYRAYITKGKKKFAFKVLSVQEPLMHEIEKLKKLGHYDGIASIYDGGSENGIHYVVTDYFNGGSLRDELQSHLMGMDIDEALKLFKPIAKAIDYLHDTGMDHGDIKPENVILCKNKNDTNSFDPVITGFGISKIVGNVQQFHSGNNYNYIAPELWKEGEPSHASDIYAFGIMLYETLEGTPPFSAKSLADKMNQHLKDKPPVPKNLSQLRGKRAVDALLQSLNKEPKLRQANAQALITQLEDKTQDNTSSTLGRITGQLMRSLRPIIKAGSKKVELSLWRLVGLMAMFIIVVVAAFTIFPRSAQSRSTPTPTIDLTPTDKIGPPASGATTSPPTSSPTPTLTFTPAPPALSKCNPQYDMPQEGCIYKAVDDPTLEGDSISVEELYEKFYGKTRTRYDEVAIVYYNNRKAQEETGYDMIDLETFNVEKGRTIFLPHPDSIEEYRKNPRPVLEAMDPDIASSKVTISGSSTLYPLSLRIKEGFENTTKYQVNIKANNTKQGLSDFCKGKAEIFGASEENVQDCPQVTFLKFELARYAVVIYINDQNPYKEELEERPLNGQELLRLLTSARSWKDVREELDPDGESVVNRYYPSPDSGAFEIAKNTIFPNLDPSSITKLNNVEDEILSPTRLGTISTQ